MKPINLTFISKPKPNCLEQITTLKSLLANRKALDDGWSLVLLHWLKQFEGFMIDLEGEENDVLLTDLNYMIARSALDITDEQLAEMVSTQHIAARLHVSHLSELWQPTLENYQAFKARHKMLDAHQVIVSKPIEAASAYSWLLQQLKLVSHA